MPVNPAAAEALAKPKIQVAKKANILSQLPNTQEQAPATQQPQQQPVSRPPPTKAAQQPQRAVVDDDMGIVRVDRGARQERAPARREPSPPEAPNPMIPKLQVSLKSRADRDGDGGAKTAGQQRAAAELERIKREQTRTVDSDDTPSYVPPTSRGSSRRQSNSSATCGSVMGGEQESAGDLASLFNDVQKMKQVLRQHERRIRLLEDELADKNMESAYGL
uniref:Uncharacterized protein n=1 Tax=Ditylenchus dipsaci TaxID=166011 RepID=A0A915D356_9BILA